MVGYYQVGDIVSYCREARAGEHGLQWSVGSRLIGFRESQNSPSERQPRTCWVICDAVPVCVAIDRLRPCTPAELLAFFHYTQTKSSSPLAADAQTKQGFINERASLHNPTVADQSRTADEDVDEDERDDEMSEPTQMTNAEKRKANEAAEGLRASLPIAASPHARSLRLDDETREQLVHSAKQSRTTKTGVETLQDVSYLYQKGHCEHQRNGFLRVRMVGMRQSNKKKLLKKKDGERNLHFPSCPPDVQAALRETRHAEWKKWMNFNAGVLLADEEVRPLTEAGCEICPMKWVDVDKKAHLRRDDDYVSVLAKYKSRLVGRGNFETTEGLLTDSPAGDVDAHNIVCSWCAQAHVYIHACDFTNGDFQGQEIDRILLFRIPAEGIPEEGFAGGAILACVPINGTKDAGRDCGFN